jgi:hypothetical protein
MIPAKILVLVSVASAVMLLCVAAVFLVWPERTAVTAADVVTDLDPDCASDDGPAVPAGPTNPWICANMFDKSMSSGWLTGPMILDAG